MPYIPYARQDRVCNDGEALGIRVFCDMINAMKFDKVWGLVPHSDVAPALLNNCNESIYSLNWDLFIRESISKKNKELLTIVSPDAGAMKRTLKFAQYINSAWEFEKTVDVVMADKVRDVRTGQIIKTTVHSVPYELEGKTCLIYDDICDGGMTFIKLAEALRNLGAKKIILAVPHGIFSKGLIEIAKVIDQIITTNVFEDNMPEYRSIDVNIMNIGNI
jgi:ribose-phosphate pyrophosphokinase